MLRFTSRRDDRRKEQTIQRIRLQFARLGHPLDQLSDDEICRGAPRFAGLCRDATKVVRIDARLAYPPRPSESSFL